MPVSYGYNFPYQHAARHAAAGADSLAAVLADATLPTKALRRVASATVAGAAATSIQITGLDINTHKFYFLNISAINATAGGAWLSCFANGDVAAGNYWEEEFSATAGALSASRNNNAYFAFLPASTATMAQCLIMRNANGIYSLVSNSCEGQGAGVLIHTAAVVKIASIANLTQLDIVSTAANSLGIGSRVEIWGAGT